MMHDAFSFKAGGIFKVGQLYAAIESYLGNDLARWFKHKGIECEVLQVKGGGWQKGKIYLRVEFIPDEPSIVNPEQESPLDDLRSDLDI
ncbi:MAG: KGK domain-containing protein [Nostoc sp.]